MNHYFFYIKVLLNVRVNIVKLYHKVLSLSSLLFESVL